MVYYLMALFTGLGMTVQAGINTQLKNVVGEPLQASLINFLFGILALAVFAALTGKLAVSPNLNPAEFSWWKLTGGFIGAFYIYTTIVVTPQIGPGNTFSLVVAGQVVAAILLDHFGLLGFSAHPINLMRLLGAGLLIVGVYIIQHN